MLLPFALIMKEPTSARTGAVDHRLVMPFAAGAPKRFPFRLMAGVGILAGVFLADILFTPLAGGKSSSKIISGNG